MELIEELTKTLEDPRQAWKISHPLRSLLFIGICGAIADCDGWTDVVDWAKDNEAWLKQYVDLPYGIPSHDTFSRIFALLDPRVLQTVILQWVQHIVQSQDEKGIAVDGKTLKGSVNKKEMHPALHLVSAWATDQQALLGQVKTQEKSNEITAIPELLEILLIKGKLITIDAMGCQKNIAAKIIEKEGGYILALKGNQPSLAAEVKYQFDTAQGKDFVGVAHGEGHTENTGHGRTEERHIWTIPVPDEMKAKFEWAGLQTLIWIERLRTTGEKTSVEHHYYISSEDYRQPERLLRAVRSHWGIENQLHWFLDVTFREDASRIRKGDGPENFALLRRLALFVVKHTASKSSLKGRRKRASRRSDYLLQLLGNLS